jgi:predicted MPP superfamily phosphohydrolase
MPITRRQALKHVLIGVGAGAVVGAGGWGVFYERHQVRLVRGRIAIPNLPSGLAGLRVGVLTDIHRSGFLPPEDLDRAVSLLMSARPDVIALLGDYVTWKDKTYLQPCVEGLEPLHAPHGVFAITGNHDDEMDTPRALEKRGFTVLDNERTRLIINGDVLEIAGINFWTRRPADIATAVRGARGPLVLLAHDPRRIDEAVALRVPLILSGHTHGGQVVLPLIGAVAARKFPVPGGTLQRLNTTLHVSRGIGTVFLPYRLNCPPEVSVLTLQNQPPPRNSRMA